MKLAIMQPYFFPYLGYFQLISAVDTFVIYDNIQYTKKGFINRNKYLSNGTGKSMTVSIQKDSDYLDIVQREISQEFDKKKLLKQLEVSYQKAPFFQEVWALIQNIILCEQSNLFEYIYHSISALGDFLDIKTDFIVSSTVCIDHSLKSQEKVLAICKAQKAETYINAIGGQSLYDYESFAKENISLQFIQMNEISYPQFSGDFVSHLSIIDVLMFNGKEKTKELLQEYSLISRKNGEKNES